MTTLTKDRRTARLANAKKKDQRGFSRKREYGSMSLAYKRLSPGTLANLIAKED